jgi:hypothetical protein
MIHWLVNIVAAIVLVLVIAIPLAIFESRAKKKKITAAFAGRDPADEELFFQRHFQARGVPADVVRTVRQILEDVLGADMSRLRTDDDFSKN